MNVQNAETMYFRDRSVDSLYTGQDPDELAAAADRLTANAVAVVPSEFLVRQPALPVVEQQARAARLENVLDSLMDELELQLVTHEVQHTRPVLSPSRLGIDEFIRAVRAGDTEKLAVHRELDVRYTWMDDIVAGMIKGWPVEIELPIWPARGVTKACIDGWDQDVAPSLSHGRLLRSVSAVLPNVRLVLQVDDQPNLVDQTLPKSVADSIIMGAGQLLLDGNVLSPNEVPGESLSILRGRDQAAKLEPLAQRLQDNGHGTLHRDKAAGSEAIWFADDDGAMLLLTCHILNVKRGKRPVPETSLSRLAVSGGTFLNDLDNEVNQQILHLGLFTHESDEIRRVLRASNLVGNEQYRWIDKASSWFNPRFERLTPEAKRALADPRVFNEEQTLRNQYALLGLLRHYLNQYTQSLTRYNAWPDIDPYAYARMHFSKVHDEDHELITEALTTFDDLKLEPGMAENVVEIGAMSNFAGAMLAVRYAKGDIKLREFLDKLIDGTIDPEFANMWPQVEDLMVEVGGDMYRDVYTDALQRSKVEPGSVYDLPVGEIDWLTAFCVLESIVDSKLPLWQLMKIASRSLRPPRPEDVKDRGGIFVGVFVVGSEGWPAGENTSFPAVNLTIEDIHSAAVDADLEHILIPVGTSENIVRFREGYKGLALMVAWPKRLPQTS